MLTKAEVQGVLDAFGKWNDALKTLDPESVAKLYADDAVLVPTLSDDVRATNAERVAYFVDFLAKEPTGELDEYNIRLDGTDDLGLPLVVTNSGLYTFTFNKTGDKARARFTYVYERVGSNWIITKHHSSALPESVEA